MSERKLTNSNNGRVRQLEIAAITERSEIQHTEDESSEISVRSSQPDEKITFHSRFRVFPYLLLSSTAFFVPSTANRVYETAYQLSFTGVNKCTLQGTIALTSLLLFL